MCGQTLARCMLSVVFTVIMLGMWLLALNQAPIGQSRASSIDYTIGGLCGTTIQACINNPMVQNGDHLIIPARHYTESLTLNKGVSLLGAGADRTVIHALTRQRVLTITGNLITETTVISGLTFTGGHAEGTQIPHLCPVNCGGGILITDSARPLIMNSNVISNFAFNAGGGIAINSDLPVTLMGVKWLSNTWGVGAGLYAEGQVRIVNGQFAQNRWGAICIYGSLIMSETGVVDNLGGGLYVSGTATIVGGRFENNSSAAGGGIIARGVLNITGTQFISNSSTSFQPGTGGGGVYILGTAAIADARFERNYSHYYGGGLRGDVVYFADDTVQFTTVTLRNTDFVSNTADFFGGGAAIAGTASIQGSQFTHNHSGDITGDGGGLAIAGPSLEIYGVRFIDNATEGSGGAIYQNDLTLTPAGNTQIVDTLFVRNHASVGGAALYTHAGGTVTMLHSTIADINTNPEEAIVVMTGTVGITDTIIASHAVAISQTAGTVYQDYNLFFGNTTNLAGAISGGAHNVADDPLFVNPIADDYHISANSAAKDTGINVGVVSDLGGLPRPLGAGFDIGAYEYPDFPNHIYLPLVVKNH